ncbi:MAG: DNA-formamidopyrimidine glycosylase family protein, partial [Acidimicrobiales bacterium]
MTIVPVPELAEVEVYRRLAEQVVGRRIAEVVAPDAWYLKRGTTAEALAAALTGATVAGTRRIGKLLIVDTDCAALGLRFGMSGRLLVDGHAAVDNLIYASNRELEKFDRFGLRFAPPHGGDLRLRDSRRLGGVELEPVEARLGPDALTVTPSALARALQSAAPLKARLMDQARLAGVGNLAADEALW